MPLSNLNLSILLVVAICLILVLIFISLRKNASAMQSESLAELRGQLSQMVQASNQQQQTLASQLSDQSSRMEQTLSGFRQQLGQSLQQQTQSTHDNLTKLSERLAVIDTANNQISELTGQVTQLHNILANKTERGAFGEVQLENLIKTVLPPNAYAFQVTLPNQKRADCVLKLPNPPGDIVIDSKFPLEAWHSLQNAETKAEQQAARKQLAIAVRGHVKDIQEKYIVAGTTAESACLFLPSEAVYAELHANMPDVIEASYKARVWIVSPTTMMATLNTVRAVLRDARMREQTAIIQAEMLKLLEDVSRLDTRVDNLNRHFSQAQKDITEIQTSTTRITKRSHKITELDVSDDEDISVIETEVKPAPTLSPATDTPS
ncbi:MAG: DNA recombination protein RmuC [Alphaproteobacteria bacterium]|nr:DNA recombination protein RmuC [Alphaproteobacteria bacterium]RCL80395.1 MAG: DNA recombination protein RmuC [SAR116 cluster bacterium]